MSSIDIVGGIYHERCIWPTWDQFFGSGGRAAAALVGHVDRITLQSYARADTAAIFQAYANAFGFTFAPQNAPQTISFEYIHCLSIPVTRPAIGHIKINPPISIKAPVVLRFGMMEGTAIVDADRCVYDPQSTFSPEPFEQNGSQAKCLAIVANRGETIAMGQNADPIVAARNLLMSGKAEIVVVKSGAEGVFIVDAKTVDRVPAFRTENCWTIGSGDVFAAMFAARWGVHSDKPYDAACLASKAVAEYVDSRSLPIVPAAELSASTRPEAKLVPGSVYIASPFFTLGQRWLVDEARRCLIELGLKVFSPVHDIGPGPAEVVAPADLDALDASNALFAILDGGDVGTVFEVGYAKAKGKPVYALAQAMSEEDLKMVSGSLCAVFNDFVTALHHVAWRT